MHTQWTTQGKPYSQTADLQQSAYIWSCKTSCVNRAWRNLEACLSAGNIRGQVYIHQAPRDGTPFINSVKQKPLTIKGMRNPLSKELHAVGCGPPKFSPLLFTSTTLGSNHFNWKVHLKSVLQKTVTKDTPEDRCWAARALPTLAICKSEGHWVRPLSPHLAQSSIRTDTPTCPRRSCRWARTESVWPPNMGWNSRLCTKLAATCFTPTWTLMWLPSPLYQRMKTLAPHKQIAAHGSHVQGKRFPSNPKEYLRVAVRFSIWLGAQLPFVFTLSHHGEGIYQLYTGRMHLVTKLQLEGVQDDLGDGQVYVKIYYSATNTKETC